MKYCTSTWFASFFVSGSFFIFIGIFSLCLGEGEALFQNIIRKKGLSLSNTYVLKNISATSAVECSLKCLREQCCASITYRGGASPELLNENCQLNNVLALNYSGDFLRDEDAYYYEMLDAYQTLNSCCFIICQNGGQCNEITGQCSCIAGFSGRFCDIVYESAKDFPARSCLEIKTLMKDSSSGVYWIQLKTSDGSNTSLQVYCDMDTYGGGWTLVYSYTFTNYDDFLDSSNAVTPIPAWPASDCDVEVSIVSPHNETVFGAVNYDLWQYIGDEFLIKSNINDWIVCQPDGGSLVREIDGNITCVNIKNVATTCDGVEPHSISWRSCGPRIYGSTTFYRYDGSTVYCYPTHDPCNSGTTKNHKRNVLNPGGKIFLR